MDRREFLCCTGAAALFPSALLRAQSAGVELGSIDGSVGGNQFTPVQFLDYLELDQADVGDDLAAAGGLGGRGGRARRSERHADTLGIKLQLALRIGLPERPRRSTRRTGTLEEQVARALKASQIFGATCMRCVLGGDAERPQIEMHIDNMIKAVRGDPLAHRRLGREARGGESRRRPTGARDEDDGRVGRHRRHGRLPRLGQSGVDARGSAHDARDADSLRRDRRTSATARSGRCRKGSPCAG